uniref:Reverse transcriptase domain-containing protein n=1 Tax=Tanacetum cinerariifolium TaxID=118510 RepID=A0A6L2M2C6_TANCI|nr:reverse transcriptase domain-containing protein [Tanacetum cinerariifolium]
MRESAKTIAPTPSSAIIQLDVDDNFVVNTTHLNMIREKKFDGYLRADPHDHIREFLAICDMFKYGETESEGVKLLIFLFSLCDEAKTWFNKLNEESITSDDGKTTGVLPNKESKTVNQEPQSKIDFEKSITKFLDGERVTNMFFKTNVNDMIKKMKQNENNFQTIFKNMERKIDEWSKSQNVSSKQTTWTEPPPHLQAHTEHVNAVFTGSGKSDDPPKPQKDSLLSILVKNKTEKDKPIKTSKRAITW